MGFSSAADIYPFNLGVSASLIPGYENGYKFGLNRDVDSAAPETIWSAGGVWTPLPSAQTLNVVSSSANDSAAGTGARVIRIYGVGGDGLSLVEDVTLAGVTPVSTVNTWLGVNRVLVFEAGSTQFNEGNISLTGSVDTTLQGYIAIGDAISQQLIFTTPINQYSYLTSVYIEITKPSGGAAPYVILNGYFLVNGVRVNFLEFRVDASISPFVALNLDLPVPLQPGTQWWTEANTDQNNTFVIGRVGQVLRDV